MAIERIKLNLIPAGTMPVCHAKQYDKKRQIGIDIYNGLQPYILSDELLELDVRKPDGHIVTIDVPYTAGRNGVVFETTEQMCAITGSNLCALKITKGEAEIGSINFFMEVEKSPLEGGLPSDSDIENLRTQMQAIAQPMLNDLVPPMVETLVPEVVGDDYYDKEDIDGKIDVINTALENKADKATTYTKEQVDDIVYGILPDNTASGSVANFNTSLALPLKSLKADVNATQDLHGYDNPWPAGGGKNIGFLSSSNAEQIQRISIEYVSKNAINLTSNGTYARVMYIIPCVPSTQYTISFKGYCTGDYKRVLVKSTNTWSASDYVTFQMTETEQTYTYTFISKQASDKICVGFYTTSNSSVGYTQIKDFQIEANSSATAFAPYENICPIEGCSEVNVVHCGKNLYKYDANKVKSGTTASQTQRAYFDLGLTNCTLRFSGSFKSGVTPHQRRINIGKLSGGLVAPIFTYIAEGTVTPQTVTFGVGEKAILILTLSDTEILKAALQDVDIQIEVGSSATSFEPFNGGIEIINLGGTYYGGHFTQDKDGHRRFEVTHGIKLASELTFRYSNNSGNWNNYLFFAQIIERSYASTVMCSNYPVVTEPLQTVSDKKMVAPSWGGNNYVYVRDDDYTSVADFISANANMQIVYVLATPYVIDLPDGETIITLNGTNNIFADTGDTSVVYKNSVADYVNAHSGGGNLLGMGGIYLGGSNSSESGGGE